MTTSLDARAERACEISAWIVMGAALILVVALHLLPAFIAGFLVYELVHLLAPRLKIGHMRYRQARMIAVAVLVTGIVLVMTLTILGLILYIRSEIANLPTLWQKVGGIMDALRAKLPAAIVARLPADVYDLQDTLVAWSRDHADVLQRAGTVTGRALAHIIVGTAIGSVLALHEMHAGDPIGPLALALQTRARRLGTAFRRVVFGQVRISAINSILTAAYLLLVLPAAGIHVPLSKTMVAVTFVVGLLPVVGNLVSNTLIVVLSLSVSGWVGIASLTFLVVIHKLEYFLNAYIIGNSVRAHAWELLIAMLAMEAAFGMTGLIAAPIYYAYLKDELVNAKLV
jgi:predicted PurR-regulated permease PerM